MAVSVGVGRGVGVEVGTGVAVGVLGVGVGIEVGVGLGEGVGGEDKVGVGNDVAVGEGVGTEPPWEQAVVAAASKVDRAITDSLSEAPPLAMLRVKFLKGVLPTAYHAPRPIGGIILSTPHK